MKTRLLKVLSLPIGIVLLPIILIIYSFKWIFYGRKSPLDYLDDYINWFFTS